MYRNIYQVKALNPQGRFNILSMRLNGLSSPFRRPTSIDAYIVGFLR